MTDTDHPQVQPITPDDVQAEQFLVFGLDKELYAVPALGVEQVVKIPPVTPVPNAPSTIVGIFHQRGSVVVVVDLARLLGIPRTHAPNYLFVTMVGKEHFGVLVDRARVVLSIQPSAIRPADTIATAHLPPKYVRGMFMYAPPQSPPHTEVSIMHTAVPETVNTPHGPVELPVTVLDLERILDHEELYGHKENPAVGRG